MKKTIVFEDIVHYGIEDGGRALVSENIADLTDDGEAGMFVRIQSWDDGKEHAQARPLEGKRVRVTVEVIGDEQPYFPHNCDKCIFLGRWSPACADDPYVELKRFDLYYCTRGPGPTVISRYGNAGHEYTSGMELAKLGRLGDLAEAMRRAHARGLIK